MARTAELLILGLGNVLCADDGLGVLTVHLLERRYRVPPSVSIVDGGTLGLSLLPLLQRARRVLMVDAIRFEHAQPGSFVRLAGAEVAPAVRERLSPHQIGVADLLDGAAMLGCSLAEIVLLGLVPKDMTLRIGLSPPVACQVPMLTRRIVIEARRFGYRLSQRPVHEKEPVRMDGIGDLAGTFGVRRQGRRLATLLPSPERAQGSPRLEGGPP
jgi:hydrogenase maturation protease